MSNDDERESNDDERTGENAAEWVGRMQVSDVFSRRQHAALVAHFVMLRHPWTRLRPKRLRPMKRSRSTCRCDLSNHAAFCS
eukprot:2548972-Amphidinium_carterae.1